MRPQPHEHACQAARPREASEACPAEEARRAGSEGPIARGTRRTRGRRTGEPAHPAVCTTDGACPRSVAR